MWRTKSPSISLDFQKQASHWHKRLSVPALSKTQTRSEGAQCWSERWTAEYFLQTLWFDDIHMVPKQRQIWGDSPGITSQMGTSRVCSKLAKLHSNFPSITPSQSPIGLSWKSWRHETLGTLSDVLPLPKPAQPGARSASSCRIFLVTSEVCCLIWK